jgi:hypothetical protein
VVLKTFVLFTFFIKLSACRAAPESEIIAPTLLMCDFPFFSDPLIDARQAITRKNLFIAGIFHAGPHGEALFFDRVTQAEYVP